ERLGGADRCIIPSRRFGMSSILCMRDVQHGGPNQDRFTCRGRRGVGRPRPRRRGEGWGLGALSLTRSTPGGVPGLGHCAGPKKHGAWFPEKPGPVVRSDVRMSGYFFKLSTTSRTFLLSSAGVFTIFL